MKTYVKILRHGFGPVECESRASLWAADQQEKAKTVMFIVHIKLLYFKIQHRS